jgi:hypothetical protein
VTKYDGELENIRVTNDYFNKLLVLEYCQFFFSLVGTVSAMISYELESKYMFDPDKDDMSFNNPAYRKVSFLLIINLLCTISLIFFIICRYIITLNWMIAKKFISPLDNLFSIK